MNIDGHILMLKYLVKASPFYLPINLFLSLLYFVNYFVGILFFKFIVNYFIYEQVEFEKVVFYFGLFYLFKICFDLTSYWIINFYNYFESYKIKKYIQQIVYNKAKIIDIKNYENSQFYDEYNRAVTDAHERLINSSNLIRDLFSSILYIFGIITLFISLGKVFVIAAFIMCIYTIIIFYVITNKGIKYNFLMTPVNRKSNYINNIFNTYQAIKELKIYKFYNLLVKKYAESKRELIKIEKQLLKEVLKFVFLGDFFHILMQGIINIYVIYKIINNQLTIGDFTLIFSSVRLLSDTLKNLLDIIPNMKKEGVYIGYLTKILNYNPEISENITGKEIIKGEKTEISLNNITFSYPNSPENIVLKDICLNIKSGTKLAIVGENGSGKSTLVKLIMYLYKVESGEILFNEIPYNCYNTNSLRSSFGAVFQDFQIFSLSIADNILMRECISDDDYKKVWEAVTFSGLYDKINSLENGIDSILTKEFDEDGIYLSGGEVQKLAIARAYAKDCNVFIFDEPSSALDSLAEKEIFQNLLKLGKNKTVIYVSHRLSSVVDADKIILIDNGEIIESGTHTELMNKNDRYAEMFTIQSSKYNIL